MLRPRRLAGLIAKAMGVGHFCGSMLSAKLFAAVTGQRCIEAKLKRLLIRWLPVDKARVGISASARVSRRVEM